MSAKVFKEFMEIGEKLGYGDVELREFVNKRMEEYNTSLAEANRVGADDKKREDDERREERRLARAHEVDMQSLLLETERAKAAIATTGTVHGAATGGGFRMRAPELPKFDEKRDDMDAYIERFERVAVQQKWEKPEWVFRLSTILTGKALEVYSQMKGSEAGDYDKVKAELLKRYQHTEEGYRLRFRDAKPDKYENSTQFVARIDRYLDRWVTLAKAPKTYEGAVDLLLREQFICASSRNLALFLKERAPTGIVEMAQLADKYVEAHGGNSIAYAGYNRNDNRQKRQSSNGRFGGDSDVNARNENSVSAKQDNEGKKTQRPDHPKFDPTRRGCFGCGSQFHKWYECKSITIGHIQTNLLVSQV
jgi:hypothetical protein